MVMASMSSAGTPLHCPCETCCRKLEPSLGTSDLASEM